MRLEFGQFRDSSRNSLTFCASYAHFIAFAQESDLQRHVGIAAIYCDLLAIYSAIFLQKLGDFFLQNLLTDSFYCDILRIERFV